MCFLMYDLPITAVNTLKTYNLIRYISRKKIFLRRKKRKHKRLKKKKNETLAFLMRLKELYYFYKFPSYDYFFSHYLYGITTMLGGTVFSMYFLYKFESGFRRKSKLIKRFQTTLYNSFNLASVLFSFYKSKWYCKIWTRWLYFSPHLYHLNLTYYVNFYNIKTLSVINLTENCLFLDIELLWLHRTSYYFKKKNFYWMQKNWNYQLIYKNIILQLVIN